MIYLDSCAIVKMVVEEDETAALVDWLRDHDGEALVTSVLAEVEVPRALRRGAPGVHGLVTSTLARLDRMDIDTPVRATAAAYFEPHLRSLDAIHLATAEQLAASGHPLTAFVTYDKRLGDVAKQVGLTVVAPGT
jgi:predicted nucleic acid-binding protein